MKSACMLPTIPQTRRNSVDGEMDALNNALIRLAVPIALEQFELHVIERIDIREPVADRAGERRVALEQALLLEDRQERLDRILPLGPQPREDRLAQVDVVHELHVARSDGD